MSEKTKPNKEKSSKEEKLWRLARNLNAIGAIAIAGVAVAIPGPNVLLASWAGINAAQAGGFELLRQTRKKKNKETERKS